MGGGWGPVTLAARRMRGGGNKERTDREREMGSGVQSHGTRRWEREKEDRNRGGENGENREREKWRGGFGGGRQWRMWSPTANGSEMVVQQGAGKWER